MTVTSKSCIFILPGPFSLKVYLSFADYNKVLLEIFIKFSNTQKWYFKERARGECSFTNYPLLSMHSWLKVQKYFWKFSVYWLMVTNLYPSSNKNQQKKLKITCLVTGDDSSIQPKKRDLSLTWHKMDWEFLIIDKKWNIATSWSLGTTLHCIKTKAEKLITFRTLLPPWVFSYCKCSHNSYYKHAQKPKSLPDCLYRDQ